MDPLATTDDRDNESEEESTKRTSDTDFNRSDSDSDIDETKFDPQLSRSEEIIVVSLNLHSLPPNRCLTLIKLCVSDI